MDKWIIPAVDQFKQPGDYRDNDGDSEMEDDEALEKENREYIRLVKSMYREGMIDSTVGE